jgi:hypothetical protein
MNALTWISRVAGFSPEKGAISSKRPGVEQWRS